jgi:hypothetical protein
MTTVTGFTASRMLAIENGTVVDGDVVGDDLHLVKRDGGVINAGNVRGPIGPAGPGRTLVTSSTKPTTWGVESIGKEIFETDTGVIRRWMGDYWRLAEMTICTSSTRPAFGDFDDGVQIYEHDTERQYVLIEGLWKLVPRWQDTPRGCLASKILSGNATANNAWTDISSGGLQVNAGANRKIHIVVNAGFFLFAGGVDGKLLSVRVEHPQGTTLGESASRMNLDTVMHSLTVEKRTTVEGIYTFFIAARTEHTVNIPINVNWQHIAFAYDMGPVNPASSTVVPY